MRKIVSAIGLVSGLLVTHLSLAQTLPSPIFSGFSTTGNGVVGGSLSVAQSFGLNGSTFLSSSNGGPSLQLAVAFNSSSGPVDVREHTFQTVLTPLTNTTNIWENVNSFLYLNGPGQVTGEIHLNHSYMQINFGAFNNQAEDYEASAENFGTQGQFDNYLSIYHNASTGSINTVYALIAGLTNDNTTPGSVGNWIVVGCGPMSGAGTAPVNNYCVQNKDPNALISTLGQVSIGGLSAISATTQLSIYGPDTSSTSFPISIKNSGGANLFFVTDNNASFFGGPMVIGTGTTVGTLTLGSTTGQAVKLIPASGTVGIVNITIPDTASTLAALAIAETFTATQTFGATVPIAGGGTVPTITAGTATAAATSSNLAGTVTEGTTQTGFTLTFAGGGFATAPHCTVTSRTAVATTYTPSTTTLVVSNASATGDIFDYVCIQ